MTSQYSQSVDVEVTSQDKKFQYIGIISVLISLGFIVLAIFISYYFLIGLVAFLAIGILNIHYYNNLPKEFSYDFNEERIIINKKDLVNKQSRCMCLLLKDIESFSEMEGLVVDSDIICANKSINSASRQIIFKENGEVKRLIFEPDDYLISLLNEHLHE